MKERKGVVDAVDVACSAPPVHKCFTYIKQKGPPLPSQVWGTGEGGVTTIRVIWSSSSSSLSSSSSSSFSCRVVAVVVVVVALVVVVVVVVVVVFCAVVVLCGRVVVVVVVIFEPRRDKPTRPHLTPSWLKLWATIARFSVIKQGTSSSSTTCLDSTHQSA